MLASELADNFRNGYLVHVGDSAEFAEAAREKEHLWRQAETLWARERRQLAELIDTCENIAATEHEFEEEARLNSPGLLEAINTATTCTQALSLVKERPPLMAASMSERLSEEEAKEVKISTSRTSCQRGIVGVRKRRLHLCSRLLASKY